MENAQPRVQDPELEEWLELIEIFTPRMAQTQQRKLKKLCEKYHIPCTWAGQGVSIDDEWLGKLWPILKVWYRKNIKKDPLEFVRGMVKKDDNVVPFFKTTTYMRQDMQVDIRL